MIGRAIAFLAAVAMVAAPAQAAPRQPTGKWVLDYAQDECLLAREYGTADNTLILTFRKFPMDEDIGIFVFKSGTKGDIGGGQAQISFGGANTVAPYFGAYDLMGKPVRRIETSVREDQFAEALRTEAISIRAPGEVTETFSVPKIASALGMLNECALNLGQAWGIPIEQQKSMRKSAKAIGKALTSADYPDQALKDDLNGRAQVRLMVDDAGRVTDCVALKSNPNKVFAETTCRVLRKRARFVPALDVHGKQMKSVVVYIVNFRIARF